MVIIYFMNFFFQQYFCSFNLYALNKPCDKEYLKLPKKKQEKILIFRIYPGKNDYSRKMCNNMTTRLMCSCNKIHAHCVKVALTAAALYAVRCGGNESKG